MVGISPFQHSQEQRWMLQLLVEGLCSPSDYRLYKKEEVFPKLMSLYHSPLTEERSKVNECKGTFEETVVESFPFLH